MPAPTNPNHVWVHTSCAESVLEVASVCGLSGSLAITSQLNGAIYTGTCHGCGGDISQGEPLSKFEPNRIDGDDGALAGFTVRELIESLSSEEAKQIRRGRVNAALIAKLKAQVDRNTTKVQKTSVYPKISSHPPKFSGYGNRKVHDGFKGKPKQFRRGSNNASGSGSTASSSSRPTTITSHTAASLADVFEQLANSLRKNDSNDQKEEDHGSWL